MDIRVVVELQTTNYKLKTDSGVQLAAMEFIAKQKEKNGVAPKGREMFAQKGPGTLNDFFTQEREEIRNFFHRQADVEMALKTQVSVEVILRNYLGRPR
ncbi:MAG: hypothetical protein Q7S62_02830 [bacterium]|nr:hypothetical protein [bacterium]